MRFVFLFRALVCLFAAGTVAAAADVSRGPEVVGAAMPEFYRALVDTVGESAAHRYLALWSADTIAFFRERNEGLLKLVAPTVARVPSVDRLYASRGGTVFGSMGETFGTAAFGRLAVQSETRFVDETEYTTLNPHGRKPDGLLVRDSSSTLVVYQVFESKLGTGGYDREQARGYLRRWKRSGVVLRSREGERRYAPEAIFLRARSAPGDDFRLVPLAEVDPEVLERRTALVCTHAWKGFRGHLVQLPFDAPAVRAVAYRWVQLLVGDRPLAPEHENFVVPALADPDELEAYRRSLREWLVERGRWPRSHETDGVELYLARVLSRRNGQARAFVEDLDDATREFLAERGALPAQSPLERRLFALSPDDPGARSALAAYRRVFEASAERSPILDALRTASPYRAAWAARFPPPPSAGSCPGEIASGD